MLRKIGASRAADALDRVPFVKIPERDRARHAGGG